MSNAWKNGPQDPPFVIADPQGGRCITFDPDDKLGSMYMLDHDFKGCVTMAVSKEVIPESGCVLLDGQKVPHVVKKIQIMSGFEVFMLGVQLAGRLVDYGIRARLSISGFTDLNGNVMIPAEFEVITREQTGPLPHKEAFFTMPVTKPCFGVAYREEPLAEGDLKRELLLDMLGDLVVGGLTKLYRRLYDEALVNPEFSGDFIAVRGACTVAFTGESDTPRQVVDLLQEEIERMRREGVDPEVFMLVKNQMYGELLGDVEAVDDAAEEAAAACLKGRTLADEIAALAALTVEDANALLQTALREENRAYVQIDPAEK